jgi:SagB-type dehydrogenase family enzyme
VNRALKGRRTPLRYRRSPHLVSYWRTGAFQIVNYATRHTADVNVLVWQILDFCSTWRSVREIEQALPDARSPFLPHLLDRLAALSLLFRSDRQPDSREQQMDTFRAWNPEAGFFHTATKDVPLISRARARAYAQRNPSDEPMPAIIKKYRQASRVRLPAPDADSGLANVLLARRTSRRYSSMPVTLDELASILGYTAGIQAWASTPDGDVALKTSPSGGARHSIECYVVARAVDGLRPGIYHYRADRHFLERIKGPVSIDRMRSYVPGSEYFASASAMVFFTSVFAREIWRYPYARAYRAAIAEAGHICQTFLLMATSLRLASYCVMGLADSLIEADLGIDGITESVLYCAGVARMPKGKGPATLPRGDVKSRPNKYLRPRASNRS